MTQQPSKIIRLGIVLVGVVLLAIAAAAILTGGKMKVTLAIITSERDTKALLTFSNQTRDVLYLDKYDACLNGRLTSNVIKVSSVSGSDVEFIGQTVKRAPPSDKDYYRLGPGQQVSTEIRLDDVFKFDSGSHEYTFQYSAMSVDPRSHKVAQLTSNVARATVARTSERAP